jgi:hypothetical protein
MSGFGKATIFNGLLGNRPNVFCWASDYLIWSSVTNLATEIKNMQSQLLGQINFCWATKIIILGSPADNCSKNA